MHSYFDCKANRRMAMKGALVVALSVFPLLSMAVEGPTEARFATVENCQFLGKIEGSSGYGKNNGWLPLAKSSALRHAKKIGASHIVWERTLPVGAFNGVAIARAYSCGS